jgi:hypothetical protein
MFSIIGVAWPSLLGGIGIDEVADLLLPDGCSW